MRSLCILLLSFGGMYASLIFEDSPRIISSENTIAESFFHVYRSNMPVAFLIDTTKGSHQNALKFYQDINRLGLNTIMLEFLLMKFNGTGRNFIFLKELPKTMVRFRHIPNSCFQSKIHCNFRKAIERKPVSVYRF